MWMLALVGAFLDIAKACIFCRLPAHALPSRLAQLSSQMEEMQWKEWTSPDFSAFALDEVTMNKITEKTHRVLRVMGTTTCKKRTCEEDAHSLSSLGSKELAPTISTPLGGNKPLFRPSPKASVFQTLKLRLL
ncbi:transmembrane protein 95 [Sigmodon hispidus]